MRRAIRHLPKPAGRPEPDATVTLLFDDRHRRRVRLDDDAGVPFLLDLPEAVQLRAGDRLLLEDGSEIAVAAAPEPVLDITCDGPPHVARVAWHIGNRHTPVQVLPDGRMRLRADHVLADMLRGLGAWVQEAEAPFDPEPGAYHRHGDGQHHHGHAHADRGGHHDRG